MMTNVSRTAAATAALALLLSTQSAQAQATPGAEDARLTQAERLMADMDIQGTYRRLSTAMVGGFAKGFGLSADDPAVSGLLTSTFKTGMDKLWTRFEPRAARIYAESFTEEEFTQLLAFYESPVGRKIVAKLPELSRKSQAAIAPLIPGLQRDMIETIADRLCEVRACTASERAGLQAQKATMLERLDALQKQTPAI